MDENRMAERERKKRRMKRRVIEVQNLEDDGAYIKHLKKKRKKRALIISLIVFAAAGIVAGIYIYWENHQFERIKVSWKKEFSAENRQEFIDFGSGFIRYNCDGASYYNSSGDVVWNQTFEMESPAASVQGSYVVFADKGGTDICICNESGITGNTSTLKPLLKADVSAYGVVAVALDDGEATYVDFYDRNGNKLEIEIKAVMEGAGYPIDLSIAPGGNLLIMSYIYLSEGLMQNQVLIYNFGEEGKNYDERLVGIFKDYGPSLVGKVEFLSDETACAFAQDRLCFYSARNTVKIQMVKQYDYAEEINSIFYGEGYAGVIAQSSDGTDKRMLSVYRDDGELLWENEISFNYSNAAFGEDCVVLYNQDFCQIYNMNGRLKYDGPLDGTISHMTVRKQRELLMAGINSLKGGVLK